MCVIVLGIPLILTILLVVAVLVSWHKNGRNFLVRVQQRSYTIDQAVIMYFILMIYSLIEHIKNVPLNMPMWRVLVAHHHLIQVLAHLNLF